MNGKSKIMAMACVVALTCMLALCLAACAPSSTKDFQAGGSSASGAANNPNYTATESTEFDVFDPNAEAENTSGTAIEGSDEEELQQERIAGGAVGAVTSTNLEPLNGVVDGSADAYVPIYGLDTEAKASPHGSSNGTDCLSCHEEGKGMTKIPATHRNQNLTSEDCTLCHSID